MGSLKFPHTSGNSMSIAAPATNPASDLELRDLPSSANPKLNTGFRLDKTSVTWPEEPS
jgi:hypothetical protein